MAEKTKSPGESNRITGEEMPGPTGPGGGKEEEDLYDLLIPPGVPRKMIADIMKSHDVELVSRKERLYFANMTGDEREILAFRGTREVILRVEEDLLKRLEEFIGH
jgi:hypothetical protein